MSLSIDVVIVAYNRWDLTESCLGHLERQTLPHQVIVSDNGSTDGTADRLRTGFPHVRLIEIQTNLAFATACNRGVAAGTGDVIVLLNNDVDCRPDFLERLVAPLEADEGVGSVAALLVQPGEEVVDSIGLVADPTLAGFPRLHGLPVVDAGAGRPALTGPAGTAAAYRRLAWEEVGGLDEAIFAYMEDFDLALRLRTAGWRTAAALDAVGVHLGSATHGWRSAWQRRNGGFGRAYLIRRYGVLRSRAAARTLATEAIVVIGDLAISRDLAALVGRRAGWRAGAGKPRLPTPPREAIDDRIRFRDALRLRRRAYARGPG